MCEIEKPLKVSVISYIVDINVDFTITDLLVLSMYLPINDVLLGIQLNYLRNVKNINRGVLSLSGSKNSFYNQLTLLLKVNNSEFKVKVFIGGKIHICGCKREEEVDDIVSILKNILRPFSVNKQLELFPIGNLVADKEDFIYSDCKIIGVMKDDNIYFHSEKVVPLDINRWISKTYINNMKNIYNNKGEIITRVSKKDSICSYDNKEIEIKENVIERLEYDIKEKTKDISIVSKEIILLNCSFKIKNRIDKEKLKDYLKSTNYHVYYEPLIYHALKVMYYFGENAVEGRCKCYGGGRGVIDSSPSSCSCYKITAIIFTNGSVLLYGSRNYEQTVIVFEWLKNILDK